MGYNIFFLIIFSLNIINFYENKKLKNLIIKIFYKISFNFFYISSLLSSGKLSLTTYYLKDKVFKNNIIKIKIYNISNRIYIIKKLNYNYYLINILVKITLIFYNKKFEKYKTVYQRLF